MKGPVLPTLTSSDSTATTMPERNSGTLMTLLMKSPAPPLWPYMVEFPRIFREPVRVLLATEGPTAARYEAVPLPCLIDSMPS